MPWTAELRESFRNLVANPVRRRDKLTATYAQFARTPNEILSSRKRWTIRTLGCIVGSSVTPVATSEQNH